MPVAQVTVRRCTTLQWTPPPDGVPTESASFTQHFFDEDNVLSLYAMQRVLLTPKVDEQATLRGGLQHVEIVWQVGGGSSHRGSGVARSKRAARREAARQLLRGLPLSDELVSQMRKQMINLLRMRLGAHVVVDGPADAGSPGRGEQKHRVLWRVPRPGGRTPFELSSEGAGRSAADAQARAWERLYVAAVRHQLHVDAVPAAPKQPGGSASAATREAGANRQSQMDERLTALSPEAAGELSARHNAIIQRHRIEARETFIDHQAGTHCTLTWRWREADGTPRSGVTTGLGTSKRTARGDAMRAMLVSQGHAEDLGVDALNQASRVRSLAKAGDATAVLAAIAFLEAWPPSAWELALPDAWQLTLARGEGATAAGLGDAMRRGLGDAGAEGLGVPPQLWEQLLDACAHVACSSTAHHGLAALGTLPLAADAFPSPVHRDYFQHFRALTAWERVGLNQAAVCEIRERGHAARGMRLEKEHCVLPYLTLGARGDAAAALSLIDVRVGDMVFVQPQAIEGQPEGAGHLATVTSLTSAEAPHRKLTLRCTTLGTADLEPNRFVVHGLDSEVTALRMVAALHALAQPASARKDSRAPGFAPALRTLLLQSFSGPGHEAARAAAEELPPGCAWADEQGRERCLSAATEAASTRGAQLTPAQVAAVQSALERRLTLIHGPPGTGKTTAAICVVLAWRPLGERILCAADSNVAADHLHAGLTRWGIRALRFSFSDPDEAAERLDGQAGSEGPSWRRRARRSLGRGERGQNSAYRQLLAMRDSLADYQIVVTTCASAGHELLQGMSFPRVLVDECTQSVEPSTLIPLSHGCAHLVLIGDHRQLPPTVVTAEARRGGLERSLFARLAASGADAAADGAGNTSVAVAEPVLLDEQRRMHPSIAAFPNEHFYAGRVRDAVPELPPVPGIPWPHGGEVRVLLVDVPAAGAEEREGTSWRNSAEAEAVLGLVLHVLESGRGRRGEAASVAAVPPLPPQEVSVITPYLQQKQALQAHFAQQAAKAGVQPSAATAGLGRVRVNTVDGFQGAESDLVIFSAVRSNLEGRLGFLLDERRANVLLTRARRGLVVFADAATMRRAKGSVWARWLAWADGAGAVMPLDTFQAHLAASTSSPSPNPGSDYMIGQDSTPAA